MTQKTKTPRNIYVGKNINSFRQKLGLNQKELAESINISQAYYSAIEIGKKPISKKMQVKFKNKYNVDIVQYNPGDPVKVNYGFDKLDPQDTINTIHSIAIMESIIKVKKASLLNNLIDQSQIDLIAKLFTSPQLSGKEIKISISLDGDAKYTLSQPFESLKS